MSLKGDIVLEDCLSIRLNQISRGDIITATSPLDPGRKVSKRVLGLQGDIVCVDPLNPTQHIVVPKNHLWVMGDNHAVSNDSRVYGPLPMGLVKGKLICRVGRVHAEAFLAPTPLLQLWPRPTMFTDYMQYID